MLEQLQWDHPTDYQGVPSLASTGAPIQVPVGEGTLGRIMDVLGRPIDEVGRN